MPLMSEIEAKPKTNHVPLSTFTEKADFCGVKCFLRRLVLTRVTVFVSFMTP